MKYYTPPQLAKMAGVNPDKILSWIQRGILKAANISDGLKRPRWRVAETDWQKFLDARSNTNRAVPQRTRRTTKPPTGRNWV